MKKEELIALGLTDEQAQQVFALNGKDVEAVKTKYADYDDLKSQVKEANETIEGFKAMDIDGIKAAAEDWKTKAEQAETDGKAKLEALQFDHALDGALSGAKAKNAKAVKALLDMEGLKFNNGEIVGLKDQLDKLKTDNEYLFESDTPNPTIIKPTPGATMTGDESLRAAMGLPPTTK